MKRLMMKKKGCIYTAILVVFSLTVQGCGNFEDKDFVSAGTGSLILNNEHGGDGAAWGLSSCESCHPLAVIHDNAANIREIVNDKGYATCTGCHGSNGTYNTRSCMVCHNMTDMPNIPYLKGSLSHNFSRGSTDPISDSDCIVCHDSSDMDGTFELARDLTAYPDSNGIKSPYIKEYDFCVRCHNRYSQQPDYPITGTAFKDPIIAIEDDYSLVDSHGEADGSGIGTYAGLRAGYTYPSLVKCSDCHSLHGTENEKLIIDSSLDGANNLPPDVRNTPYPVDTSGGNFSQLCVLCHSMYVIVDSGAVDTGNGLAGVHEVTGDCRPCHTHGEAVQSGL